MKYGRRRWISRVCGEHDTALAAALLAGAAFAADFDALDCKVRGLAFEYAQKLQGDRATSR